MANVPQKNIYVREKDVELWEWAVSYAEARRMTVSGLLMNALEDYREKIEQDRDPETDRP